MSDEGKPLPSEADAAEPLADGGAPEPEGGAVGAAGEGTEPTPAARPARPPPPPFKISTFLYVFLGLLGLWMLIDSSARNAIACTLGTYPSSMSVPPNGNCSYTGGPLYWLIGFHSDYLLLTMALAGAVEMLITAVAYNYTTNWVKAAKVQKWSAAFRKVQMEAIRSGKKDRIAALKPQQEKLTRLSGEVSIAQFKGMAITYFLLILIYTWVWLVISAANPVQRTVNFGAGASVSLMSTIGGLPIPIWFVIFSLYTVPFSLIFRRLLKHLWLRKYSREHNITPAAPASETAGGPA